MRVKRIVSAMMAGCAAVIIASAPGHAAQSSHDPHPAATVQAKAAPEMTAKCQAMMAERERMMTDMKAADQRLDGLVLKMNAASGMEKMTATAAVVTEIVSDRRTMRDATMKMQHDMMAHMMEHMQAGKESMAMCPMMKEMNDRN